MQDRSSTPPLSKKWLIALAVILSLIAIGFTMLAPGFEVDNSAVYAAF